MKAIEQLERLKRMNELIKAECTGTPEEFSKMLRISRRQLYAEIEYFKDLGVEIGYSRMRRTFFFCNGHEIEIFYRLKIIPKEVAKKINGGLLPFPPLGEALKGKGAFSLPCFFYARNESILAPGLKNNP